MRLLFYPRKLVQFSLYYFVIMTVVLGSIFALLDHYFQASLGKNETLILFSFFLTMHIVLFLQTLSASWFAWRLYVFLSLFFIMFLASACILMGGLFLIFYFIFMTVSVFYMATLIEKEIKKPHYAPKKMWFQGQPQGIPLLNAKVKDESDFYVCNINRLDEDGAHLFFSYKEKKGADFFDKTQKNKKNVLSLNLEFGEKQVEIEFFPVSLYRKTLGLGVLFKRKTMDQKKELGDLIELLRGAGYVAF